MFDLNQSVNEWKLSLLNKETFNKDDIDELVSHLYEQIENLRLSGLTDEEAYLVAQKRIGNIDVLTPEYQKVNSLDIIRKRIYWMLFGVAIISLVNSFTGPIYFLSYSLVSYTNINIITLTYLIYSAIELLFLLPFSVVVWIMVGKSTDLISYTFIRFVSAIRIKQVIIMVSGFLILIITANYLMITGREFVNISVGRSEGFHEYLEITKILGPGMSFVNLLLMIALGYFSHKKIYGSGSLIHSS